MFFQLHITTSKLFYTDSVSYTHLDVYKRQPFSSFLFLPYSFQDFQPKYQIVKVIIPVSIIAVINIFMPPYSFSLLLGWKPLPQANIAAQSRGMFACVCWQEGPGANMGVNTGRLFAQRLKIPLFSPQNSPYWKQAGKQVVKKTGDVCPQSSFRRLSGKQHRGKRQDVCPRLLHLI